MNLKTFTASSMNQALAQVRQSLGSDAVILHTRTYRRGGWFGWRTRPVVEITAADPATVRAARRPAATNPTRGANASTRSVAVAEQWLVRKKALLAEAASLAKPSSDLPRPHRPANLLRQAYGSPGNSPQPGPVAEAVSAPRPAAVSSGPADVSPVLTKVAASQNELAQEMQEVRRLVARVIHQQRVGQGKSPAGDLPESLMEHYLSLIKQEVAEELAEQIVQQVKQALPAQAWSDQAQVRLAIRQAMGKHFLVDDQTQWLKPTADGRPRTLALIGPTGVGKTTTLAKLAANFKLKQQKNVALITLDTYRIAAVEQLRTYAQIIGVPLYVVGNPQQMYEAMDQARRGRAEVILIDTAGRCPKDDPRLDQLAAYLQIAQPHEVHLVLSSTSTQAVMLDAVDRFARIRTDRVIFTKLDEAVGFGVLLNVASKVNKCLSFITTGQEVPHDIEAPSADRLAMLVLEGGHEGGH